ncbi:MAG: DUF3147 family protein [Gammaproteobacteria bacterium]|nr:DUF3147 family protein [Gammaproteobacteria bacterium]
MFYYLAKIALTAGLVLAISEIAKRSSFAAAILASIPLISILAIFWLYLDTRDLARVSALASSIFWLVLPSLALFISLPVLLRQGLGFFPSMTISITLTVGCYWVMLIVLGHYGVKL